MKKTQRLALLLLSCCTLALWVALPAHAEEHTVESALEDILVPYENIRQALVVDRLDGVPEHGRELADLLDRLRKEWPASASTQGRNGETTPIEAVRALLPEVSTAADDLAGAQSLDSARDAFYALSKPLVRWRKLVDGERPEVAYCSMARRSWLQPKGELGNPYYGPSMPRCGEFVDG